MKTGENLKKFYFGEIKNYFFVCEKWTMEENEISFLKENMVSNVYVRIFVRACAWA